MKLFRSISWFFFVCSPTLGAHTCVKPDPSKIRIEPSDCQSALMEFDRFFTGTIHYDEIENRKSCFSCQVTLRSDDGKHIHASTKAAFKVLDQYNADCPFSPGRLKVISPGISTTLTMEIRPGFKKSC